MRQKLKISAIVAVALLAAAVFSGMGSARAGDHPSGVKNIVLVHGAFADGSSWARVIPLLQAKGFTVTAVQNPLTSLKDDAAATKRAIDGQSGRVLLVGHSWGGAVITQVGTDPKVAGLVFVAAGAPDAGQSFSEMAQGYPTPPGIARLKADAAGFLALPPSAVASDFAQDLPSSETAVMAVTQGPIAAACFGTKVTVAAWKSKPSWYIVANQDRMIDPNLERALAKKIKARTLELDSGHAMMLSRPQQVATFIANAAASL
jgi:pimeloyl-ACP methyl ester carboxylesterase